MAMNNGDDMINVTIKTVESQTYFLRVHKQVPVAMLREQITLATGILAQNQCIIYGGGVLRDEHTLSFYNVEDGHTLHLVIRQSGHAFSRSMPNQSVPGPVHTHGQFGSSFAQGAAATVSDVQVHLANRIIMSLIATSAFNAPASPEVLDAMTTLRHEVDLLNRLYQTHGGIVLAGNQSAAPPNPRQRVDPTPESLASLLVATRPLINSVLGRLDTLAWEIQMHLSNFLHQRNIQWLAWTLGTQLQDVGMLLLELGRVTSTLQITRTNRAGGEMTSGPAVFLNQFRPNPFPSPGLFQTHADHQPHQLSQPRTSDDQAGAGVMLNTGPSTSNTGNQVEGSVPPPDTTASESQREGD